MKKKLRFDVYKGNLYPTYASGRAVNERLARRIAGNLIKDYGNLPLQWEKLNRVVLWGHLDESITAQLYFDPEDMSVMFPSVYVGDKGEILQCGTNYGNLVY
jgi:hypothetical protein